MGVPNWLSSTNQLNARKENVKYKHWHNIIKIQNFQPPPFANFQFQLLASTPSITQLRVLRCAEEQYRTYCHLTGSWQENTSFEGCDTKYNEMPLPVSQTEQRKLAFSWLYCCNKNITAAPHQNGINLLRESFIKRHDDKSATKCQVKVGV